MPVTHDVVVDKFEIPGSVMANNDVKAKVTLRNLLDVAETEYTSNLYFDGAEVATAQAVEIPANGTATVEFTFVANEVGTFPAKAEFVWADEYTVATDEVEVEVTEEQTIEALCACRQPLSLTVSEDGDDDITQVDIPIESGEEKLAERLSLEQELMQLAENDRQLILLRYYKGLTQSQTAKILGTSQVQISRKEKKILGMLREKLL